MNRFLWAFLFLALSSFSYASKTYYYYSTGSFCSATPDNVCTSLNVTNAEFSRTYSGDVNVTGEGLTCGFNIRRFNYYGIGQDLVDNFSGEYPYTYHAVKAQKICDDNDQFVLNGCVAECVKNDPCEATKDQEETLRVQCGIMGCQQGAKIVDLGANVGMSCSAGNGTFYPSDPPLKLKRGDCEWVQNGAAETPDDLSDVKGDSVDAGQQNAPTYCTVRYKSSGRKFPDSETPPTNKVSSQPTGGLKFNPSIAAPNSDGGCNQGWTLGEYGSGTNLTKVCVPPSPSTGSGGGGGGGTCTITGQTQVNGVCSCPSGQTVQNGACSSSTGGGGGGTCTITGQTQVNGVCSCPSGQTVQNGACSSGSGSSGSYTGSNKCDQAPACSGDAVLCGLIAEQYKTKCETFELMNSIPTNTQEALNKLGEAVTDNQDINSMKQHVSLYMNELKSLIIPFFSSCVISNIELQILSKPVIIPLSQFCPFFELIRLLLNITVDLVVLRIVSRAILSAS